MAREIIDYSKLTGDTKLLETANGIRKAIQKVLPEGAFAYKLLGLKVKKSVWPYGVKKIGPYNKPQTVTTPGPYSLEQMSKAQIGYFGNMNNLQSLDNLKNIRSYGVVNDPIKKDNWLLIMIERSKDSLGRIIETKNGVIFRPYTQEEEEEYQARLDEKEAAELGIEDDTEEIAITADF